MKQKNKTLRALAALIVICLLGASLLCSCAPARSIQSATVNDAGELILTYSDGTAENLGVVRGEDGEQGAPGLRGVAGKKGKDGEKGETGENGKDGEDGVITVVPDTETVALAAAKGLRSAVSIYCEFSDGTEAYASAGAGVIYRLDRTAGDSLIITNHHVVYDADSLTPDGICDDITVYLYGEENDGFGMEAEYVGGSMRYDLAVLSIKGSERIRRSDAVAVTLGSSAEVSVGTDALAIGNAKGLGTAASLGVVSVDSEQIEMTAADGRTAIQLRVMRIDTAVNPGNSGGGLYNRAGELIGIVNAKIISDDVENIAYAIPSDLVIAVVENIIEYCLDTNVRTVMRAVLDVTIGIQDSRAEYDVTTGKIKIVETVEVKTVAPTSPAYGKLQTDDVLQSVMLGTRTVDVTRSYHMTDLMLYVRAGDVMRFTVLRDGVETTVDVAVTGSDITSY